MTRTADANATSALPLTSADIAEARTWQDRPATAARGLGLDHWHPNALTVTIAAEGHLDGMAHSPLLLIGRTRDGIFTEYRGKSVTYATMALALADVSRWVRAFDASRPVMPA